MIGTMGLLTNALKGVYTVMEFVMHPWQHGKPAKRPRRLAIAWRTARVAFHGSQSEYLELFETRVELDGTAFLLASDECRASEKRALAANARCNHFPKGTLNADIDLCHVLPPNNMMCLKQHKECATPHCPKRSSPTGVYITDVDQSMSFCLGSPFFLDYYYSYYSKKFWEKESCERVPGK